MHSIRSLSVLALTLSAALAAPARAQLSNLGTFNPSNAGDVCGLGVDPANGDVWGCCTKAKPLGNLRQNGFDFDAIWRSQDARSERADIKAGKCACPLANAAYTSILCDAGALVQVGRNLVNPGKGTA